MLQKQISLAQLLLTAQQTLMRMTACFQAQTTGPNKLDTLCWYAVVV